MPTRGNEAELAVKRPDEPRTRVAESGNECRDRVARRQRQLDLRRPQLGHERAWRQLAQHPLAGLLRLERDRVDEDQLLLNADGMDVLAQEARPEALLDRGRGGREPVWLPVLAAGSEEPACHSPPPLPALTHPSPLDRRATYSTKANLNRG